jgi:hypothetical protein
MHRRDAQRRVSRVQVGAVKERPGDLGRRHPGTDIRGVSAGMRTDLLRIHLERGAQVVLLSRGGAREAQGQGQREGDWDRTGHATQCHAPIRFCRVYNGGRDSRVGDQ